MDEPCSFACESKHLSFFCEPKLNWSLLLSLPHSSSHSSSRSSFSNDSSRLIQRWEKVRDRFPTSFAVPHLSLLTDSYLSSPLSLISISHHSRRASPNRVRSFPPRSQSHVRLLPFEQVLRSLHAMEASRPERYGKAATRVPRIRPVDIQ